MDNSLANDIIGSIALVAIGAGLILIHPALFLVVGGVFYLLATGGR